MNKVKVSPEIRRVMQALSDSVAGASGKPVPTPVLHVTPSLNDRKYKQ